MQIKNHKLVGAEQVKARDIGAKITPELVILHDTAGRLDKGNSVEWLGGNPGHSSVHFVVERDGSVTQMVPTNRRANHAGKSHYHGRNWVNGFSIGIEIVNPGRMVLSHEQRARTWWGQEFDLKEWRIMPEKTPEHGDGWWMDYTAEQIAAVQALLAALFESIDTLRDIRTHWYVSPGRKVDTNPLFPLEQIRAKILGRDDAAARAADDVSHSEDAMRMVEIDVPGDVLNMREWPSFNPNTIAQIPHGVLVPVERSGVFAGRNWLKILYAGREGWIVEAYTKDPQHDT